MQCEHFYHCQITTRVFHHNLVCKLQSERFPVVLLITCFCMHITKLIIRNIREELIVKPF